MRVVLRPTVGADLADVIDVDLPHRIRALTAVIPADPPRTARERILGVGGIGYRPDGTVIAFVAMVDDAKRYPAAIHRAGLAAMKMIRESGVRLVVAEAQAGNPAAEPWLKRLGFRPTEISGRKAFVWERPADA